MSGGLALRVYWGVGRGAEFELCMASRRAHSKIRAPVGEVAIASCSLTSRQLVAAAVLRADGRAHH